MSPVTWYQFVAVLLLGIGLFGLVSRRTLVGMLISVELTLNGAGLSMAAAAQFTDMDAVMGQLGVLFVMGLAAAEATLVLAILVIVSRRVKSTQTDAVSQLRG
mgnify:CR=1 FL=1